MSSACPVAVYTGAGTAAYKSTRGSFDFGQSLRRGDYPAGFTAAWLVVLAAMLP